MKNKPVLGFAMCGSFCTLKSVVTQMSSLANDYDILPIMSQITYETDTRFGTAEFFRLSVSDICKKNILHTITDVEPIGPKGLTDIMLIAPCTGNTLAKLAGGITDTAVTMAAKAHLRNGKPLVIALATNDALSAGAKNIGMLLNCKNVYFVPFSQDDPQNKDRSCIADMTLIPETLHCAAEGRQINHIIR